MISVPATGAGRIHAAHVDAMRKQKSCGHQSAALWVWMDWTAAFLVDIHRDLQRPPAARYDIDHAAWLARGQAMQDALLTLLARGYSN